MSNTEIWLETLITATPQEGRELEVYCSHTNRCRNKKETAK